MLLQALAFYVFAAVVIASAAMVVVVAQSRSIRCCS